MEGQVATDASADEPVALFLSRVFEALFLGAIASTHFSRAAPAADQSTPLDAS